MSLYMCSRSVYVLQLNVILQLNGEVSNIVLGELRNRLAGLVVSGDFREEINFVAGRLNCFVIIKITKNLQTVLSAVSYFTI